MLMDPHPSQQHAGLHHAVWQLQQEVTRPKARFKPTSPKKSEVDGGADQVPTYSYRSSLDGNAFFIFSFKVAQLKLVWRHSILANGSECSRFAISLAKCTFSMDGSIRTLNPEWCGALLLNIKNSFWNFCNLFDRYVTQASVTLL